MAIQNFGAGGGGYQQSPGINISEIDLTTVQQPLATSTGAIGGVFRWGPVGERVLVSSENDLVKKFGKPSNVNAETFFSAASFLAYSNSLYVSRAGNDETVFSAIANATAFSANSGYTINNKDDYDNKEGSFGSSVLYIARSPGALGNSLKVSVCSSADAYQTDVDLRNTASNTSFNSSNTKIAIAVGSNTATVTLANSASLVGDTPQAYANTVAQKFNIGDYIEFGNTSIGKQTMKVTNISNILVVNTAGANSGTATFTISFDQPLKLSSSVESNTAVRYWEYYTQVDAAPGQSPYVAANGNTAAQDEVHVVVVDEDGEFTGNPGAILEVYQGLSRATDSKNSDGTTNYYKNVINDRSDYVWWAADSLGAASDVAADIASSTETAPVTISFQGGTDVDESSITMGDIARAYDLFSSTEEVDLSLVITGKTFGGSNGEQLANYLIDNVAEARRDCMVFASPQLSDVLNQPNLAAENIIEFRNSLRSSSFAVLDTGYKYMYDKYNDVYRWIPLNGDIAGLCAFTDSTRDPWFSPAGYSRGFIRNVVKLAYNPTKTQRDQLYKNNVNPVITQTGQGTLLFGDKTLQAKASAFDRINVRRLFIVLEKTIEQAARSLLFEFNDEFTRTQFLNLVEPFLRDVQGRRGIYDFKVVCDESNNTPDIIDNNRFVGDIYVKPARSINYIQLNFVAVRTGVQFSEIVS